MTGSGTAMTTKVFLGYKTPANLLYCCFVDVYYHFNDAHKLCFQSMHM